VALVDQLPSDWEDYRTEQKLAWFNANGVTASDLANAGVDQDSIDWIEANRYPKPAVIDEAAQERLRIEEELRAKAEAARLEAARLEAERIEAQIAEAARVEAERQEAARVEAARVEAARQEAIRQDQIRAQQLAEQQEAASQRSTYGLTIQEYKDRLLAGNPSNTLLDQRVLEITLENGWTPEKAVEITNKAFGTNKTVDDYRRAVSQVLQDPITKLVQNGSTSAEVKQIGIDLGIDAATLDTALQTAIKTKTSEDIAAAVRALAPAGTGLSYDKIVKYADDNKLAYADVANALQSVLKDTTAQQITDAMAYEKDRQQIDSIATETTENGKTVRTVDLSKALGLAISKGIELDNLLKFFGKTPVEFKALVNNNLGSISSAIRNSGVNAPIGLADLLGIDQSATNTALKEFDTKADLNNLAVTVDGKTTIPMDKALDYAKTNKISDADLGRYLNINQDVIAQYRDQIDTKGKLDALKATDNTLTLNEVLGLAASKNMTPEAFAKAYLGGGQETIDSLNREASYTPQERAWREEYTLLKTPPTIDQIFTFQNKEKLSDADYQRIFGDLTKLTASDLDKARVGKEISALKESGGNLTSNELLGLIGQKQMTIDDFVRTYLGDNKDTLAQLKAESVYTPQERAWRETIPFDAKDFGKITEFQAANKLSDADMERVFGIPTKSLDTYRVTTEMNKYAGEDKQLSYAELAKFAQDNKMDLSKLVGYLGTEETRPDILKNLQDYVADSQLTPAERLTTQLEQITKGGTTAGVWDKNQGWEHHSKKMVDYLTQYGITDLNQIGTRVETRNLPATGQAIPGEDFRATEGEQAANYVVYFDKNTGKELQAVPQSDNGGMWRFGSEGKGKGSTGYFLGRTADNGVGIASNWEEKYGAKEYALPLAVAAAFAAPYLLPELIGAAGAAVDIGAVASGTAASTTAVASGATGMTGMLMAAGMPAAIAAPTAAAIVRGTYQGLVNEAAGGDFAKGFVSGGIAPVISNLATKETFDFLYNQMGEDGRALFTKDQSVIAARAVGSALNQLIVNGDIDLKNLVTTTVSPYVTQALVSASDNTITPAQAKFITQTVFSGAKNITDMANNPLAVMNFVQNNSKLIDEIASGTTGALTSNKITLNGLTNDQQRSLAEVSEPGSDISQLASVTVTAGSDTAMGAEGIDQISQTPSVEVVSKQITSPPSALTTIDNITPAIGLGSLNTGIKTPTVTVQSTRPIDEQDFLDVNTFVPGLNVVTQPDPVIVGSKSDTETKNKLSIDPEAQVTQTATTANAPVIVKSTPIVEDPVLDISTLIPDINVDKGGILVGGTPQVVVTGKPIVGTPDPLDMPTITPEITPVTTTPQVTTTTPITTTPPITIPPIVVDPGIKVNPPVGVTTTTTDNTMAYQYPTVGGPELPTYYGMPYPNYLRPFDPYLPMGLGALMEAMNAKPASNN
jgi:hypothetical protein